MRRFAKPVYGSYRTAGSNPALSVSELVNQDAGRCQEARNGLQGQEHANPGSGRLSAQTDPAQVHPDERSVQGDGPESAKQNAKQNAKRVFDDPDVSRVVDAWPHLPEAARTVILATVEAYAGKGKE